MEKLLACFSCQSKPSTIIAPVKMMSDPFQKNNDYSLLEEEQKTKTMTTLTFRQSESTRILSDLDSQVQDLVRRLRRKPLNERKKIQANFIKKNLDSSSQMYLIQKNWSEEYTVYLNVQHSPPILNMRQIDNSNLFSRTNKLKSNIQQKLHYYLVTKKVWTFVKMMYGGGPDAKKQNILPVFVVPAAGLKNNLYYCYMNTAIQILLSIGQFAYYFKNKMYHQSTIQSKSPKKLFSFYTYKIIRQFIQDHQSSRSLKQFSQIFQDRFYHKQQHDCQQFIRYYLQMLQDQNNPPLKKTPSSIKNFKTSEQASNYYVSTHPSIIDTLFFGQHTSTVRCLKCDNISTTYEAFLELTIDICKDNLQGCFKNFFSQQKLTDLYECQKCKQKTKAIKQLKISKTPAYLMITLKRFLGHKQKNQSQLSYPYNLNIEDFCKLNSGNGQYFLHSIVIHKGTLEKGHYYCITRRGQNKWYQINDEKYSEVSIKDHLDEDAYILIYQRQK